MPLPNRECTEYQDEGVISLEPTIEAAREADTK